ncbi:MAG: ribosome biogenesis GTP-binding protein YihA/YsxC [Pseudomonadota bacterium]
MGGLASHDQHDDEALEIGRHLFAQSCDFMLSVASIKQLPATDLPEVAFVGRSNVGKSTLINALTNQKQLARTSNTPGRTQQINLFNLGNRLILADLPGYGFAKAPKPTVESWHRLIQTYLKGRPTLRIVCILVDSRHGLKAVDEDYMKLLANAAVAYRIVLTKADQVKADQLTSLLQELRSVIKHKIGAHPDPIAVSAKDQEGIAELRAELAAFALSQ